MKEENWEKDVRLDLDLPEFYGLVCKFERNHDMGVKDKIFEQIKVYIVKIIHTLLETTYQEGFADGLCTENTQRDEQCIEDIKKAREETIQEIIENLPQEKEIKIGYKIAFNQGFNSCLEICRKIIVEAKLKKV